MRRLLLDTNAYSRLMAGDRDVLSLLGSADLVYLSVFVIGELYAGFFGGGRAKDNRLQLEKFKSKSTVKVLAATEETAQIFGSVKNKLRQAGTPIPVNRTIRAHVHCIAFLLTIQYFLCKIRHTHHLSFLSFNYRV
jgi:tRNA(fMet)-specific endonuclease VapC